MAATHYETLGVPQTATQEEIKSAYRAQCMKWHPDNSDGSMEYTERFKRIEQAYATLRDASKRALYDASLGDTTPRPARSIDLSFAQEMRTYASKLAFQQLNWPRIAELLQEKGCPHQLAESISREAVRIRAAAPRPLRAGPLEWDLPLHPRKPKGRRR